MSGVSTGKIILKKAARQVLKNPGFAMPVLRIRSAIDNDDFVVSRRQCLPTYRLYAPIQP
jgi:hypothetical protein